MTDWSTISSLATAGGTLVLAVATFASVRSSSRAARSSERSFQAGVRPVLLTARPQDPPEKVGFMDGHWVQLPGGRALADVDGEAIYLAISVRNVGRGLAVLHGWRSYPERLSGERRPDGSEFRRLTRDLYVAGGDGGFWQGTYRDPTESGYAETKRVIEERQPFTIDVLYGDHEGGQRTISRFALTPHEGDSWLAVVVRHWNLDRADPR